MSGELSYTGLCISLFLPWLCGAVWVRCLLGFSSRRNHFVIMGHGYFAGLFITTLLLRAWDAAGLALEFTTLAWVMLAATAAGLGLSVPLSRYQSEPAHVDVGSVPRWQTAVVLLLLALVAWRYSTLAQEVSLRPLYAWDAWMNWAPKAITWFHQGQLVEFVHHRVWLNGADITTYTLGNRMASLYPENVPLMLLWSMMGLGTWDSGLAYLPWVIAPLALGLALYGHLRLAGVGFFVGALACYALLNMPYPNVHSALAGYADSWLGMVFCLAVLSLYELGRNRHWAYAVLCLYLAVFCSLLKNPGVVLGLIVAAVMLRECLRLKTVVEWTAAVTIVAVVAALFILGIDVNIPGLGRFSLGASGIQIPGIRPYELSFNNVSAAWLETMFVSWNWNLFWYLLFAGMVYRLCVTPSLSRVSPETLAALGALCFLLFVFFFTRHHSAATNFVTLNRTLLYLVPTLIFIVALRYSGRSSLLTPEPAAEQEPAPRQPIGDEAATAQDPMQSRASQE